MVLPLSLMLIIGLGFSLLIKHLVTVKDIVFIGNHHLKNEELKSLIRVRTGDELFARSGRELYGNLKRSPWIKEVAVRKELSGRVLVKVTERVPVAILSLAGAPYLIDNDGRILEQLREGALLLLPVIKDIDPSVNRATYAEAVRFMGVLRARNVVAYDGDIVITGARPEDLTLTVENVAVKVGMGDFEKKLERLEFVKDEIQRRNMQVDSIDLRFANKIVVKPVSQASPDVQPQGEEQHGKKKKR